MTTQGEEVLFRPGHLKLASHVFCGQAHADIDAGIFLGQCRVGHKLIAAHGNAGHGFHATGDNGLTHPAHNLLGRQGDGLQTAGAEAVDRLGRYVHRQAGL